MSDKIVSNDRILTRKDFVEINRLFNTVYHSKEAKP